MSMIIVNDLWCRRPACPAQPRRPHHKRRLSLAAITFAAGLALSAEFACGQSLPADVAGRLGNASASFTKNELVVSTGQIERTWRWTGAGLVTVGLDDAESSRHSPSAVRQSSRHSPSAVRPVVPAASLSQKPDVSGGRHAERACYYACDWDLPGAIGGKSQAELVSVTIKTDDDEGFTGKHLEVVSTIRYPQAKLEIQHVVWAFPDAPGLRVQLRARALAGFDPKQMASGTDRPYQSYGGTFLAPGSRIDYLPLDFSVPNSRRYWGYYNDPGNRHDQSKDMLEEKIVRGFPIFQPEAIDWASGAAVEYGDQGVVVVKESPKCVNQQAHLTGGFFSGPQGLAVTGWGLAADEIVPDRFRECWATWTIVYRGGNDGMQLALKQFDAARYPVVSKRDMFILANTWGPANPGGAQFTAEDFVLKEIPALADLGVDVLQIDDGWQKAGGGSGANHFLPKYADGWKSIKAAADRYGVRLGLWVAIRNAKLADLKKNLDELGFITWKVDYDHLASRSDYEARIAKYRAVMNYSPKTQFTLCPEYDDPRYGWYFAKEYGSIYFQNIQEGLPPHLTMVPYQVLRQHWLMAKYFPANKLQVMLQNPKRTRRDVSDAYLHSHGYCFAMGLPFVPEFFQSAQFLDEEGRKELKALIALYKRHRDAIFTSYAFPIGDEPDNASWSGFQMVAPDLKQGYLLVFRELHNEQPRHEIALKFLAGKSITIEDLQSGTARTTRVPQSGLVEFEIEQAPGYRFLKYTAPASGADYERK